jgi:FtsZ-binding cell division protein ZapB
MWFFKTDKMLKEQLEQENAALQSSIAEIKKAYDQLKIDFDQATELVRKFSAENNALRDELALFQTRQQANIKADNNKYY